MLVAAATAATYICAVTVRDRLSGTRRKELVGGEVKAVKELAGVVGGGDAFFLREAEVVGRHEHLDVALELDDGKNAERDVDVVGGVEELELAAKPSANALRDMAIQAAAIIAFATNLCGQANWLSDLHSGLGKISKRCRVEVQVVVALAGVKNLDFAVAAEENDLLCEDRQAIHADRAGRRRHKHIEVDLEEECHVDRVKALIEGDGLEVDVDRENIRGFNSHRASLIYDMLAGLGEVDAQIIEAILIGARVVDAKGIDANRFLETSC